VFVEQKAFVKFPVLILIINPANACTNQRHQYAASPMPQAGMEVLATLILTMQKRDCTNDF